MHDKLIWFVAPDAMVSRGWVVISTKSSPKLHYWRHIPLILSIFKEMLLSNQGLPPIATKQLLTSSSIERHTFFCDWTGFLHLLVNYFENHVIRQLWYIESWRSECVILRIVSLSALSIFSFKYFNVSKCIYQPACWPDLLLMSH